MGTFLQKCSPQIIGMQHRSREQHHFSDDFPIFTAIHERHEQFVCSSLEPESKSTGGVRAVPAEPRHGGVLSLSLKASFGPTRPKDLHILLCGTGAPPRRLLGRRREEHLEQTIARQRHP